MATGKPACLPIGYCEAEGNIGAENETTQPPGNEQPTEQRTNEVQPGAQRKKAPVQDYKEDYGAWMLVTRKDRRGQRMENHNPGSHNRDHNRNQSNYTNPAGLVTNSRYAVLEQMNDTETEYAQGNNIPVAPFNSTPKNLPRIRTSPQTQHTQRVTNQERIPQPQNFRQPQPSGQGGLGNRRGRGGAPRRAAVESEHTVVRGTDMDYELLGDPPDVPRGSSSRLNDVDAIMSDETGVGQVASDQ
nr:uncharacterized protein LOC109179535 isoform X2 [Ipomoea batatas]